jgi:drug/metabolite transporter (DMT)-like permease
MKGMMLAFIATALFNLYALFCKVLVGSVDPVLLLICVQVAAGTLMIALMDLSRKMSELWKTSTKDLLPLFLIGVVSSAIAPVLFLTGLKMTTLTNTVLISRAEGVVMSILAVFMLKEAITKHQIAGTGVMFFGIWFIAAAGPASAADAPMMGIGDILVFISAAAYAFSNVLFKRYLHHLPAEVIVSMRNVFGAASLLVAVFVLSVMPGISYPIDSVLQPWVAIMLGAAILSMIAGQFLWYVALEKTTATRVSAAILFSPVIGVAFAAVLLGEAITMAHVIGGLFIVGGLVLMELHTRKVKSPEKRKYRMRLRPIHGT